MEFKNSNLDYWTMSDMILTNNFNIVEMNCASRDCRDCDCECDNDDNDDDDEDNDDDGWDEETIIDYMYPDEEGREDLYD